MARVLSATQYCDIPRPQLSWLIPSYVPNPGLVLLIGEAKAGKSFLGLQVAMHVASGTPFLGQPIAAASVLYLQFDTSEIVWRQRLMDLRASGIVLPDNLFFLHPEDQPPFINILSTPTQMLIAQTVAACQPKLVVVDVLRECHDEDENDSGPMKLVGDQLMRLFAGRTLLIVHHTHKISPDFFGTPSPTSVARGSSYITGKADAIWYIRHEKLQIVSRFHLDETHNLKRLPNGLWGFLENPLIPRASVAARMSPEKASGSGGSAS